MKFSENWLREWVNPAISTEQLVDQLTMAGLEVEGIETAGAELSQVVVAEITSFESHPNADKLNLCQVFDSVETVPVVCGARNVRQGMKVVFARVGAKLPGFKIKKAKLRGIESFGMLCSASELELAETSNGILELPSDAPCGTSFHEYLGLNDNIIEVDLTPNRGDCLSIAGVAREVAALNNLSLSVAGDKEVAQTIDDRFSVDLLAPEACPHYVGRVIKNIDGQATTPLWMQEKLRRCGLRPISPVVDVTNYIMMELGQPMHGFDLDKLEGGIRVRMAQPGEKITLLDHSEVECRDDTLVIADHNKALAMAGIMGGLDSSVQDETKNVFLEAAFFTQIHLAGKARSYGMHTDSSHRFERGVDFGLQIQAMHRATELLLEIVGGEAGPIVDALEQNCLPTTVKIPLRYGYIKRLLGIDVDRSKVVEMLEGLNMQVENEQDDWLVTPPTYRFDIKIEADLIEEVGRMVGYNNIPGVLESSSASMEGFSETRVTLNQVRNVLVEQGLYEAVTYSFVSPEMQSILDPGQATLELSNPISADMSTMRTSLLPGLVQALQHNINRQQSRVRLFEEGLCFIPGDDGLAQRSHLAAIISGTRDDDGIYSDSNEVDFFDIKGVVEAVLGLSELKNYRFVKTEKTILHPGQGADIYKGDKRVGYIGSLHPQVNAQLRLNQPAFVFELELETVLHTELPGFTEMSRFPSIRRDISLMVDHETSVQSLIDCIFSVKSEILRDVFLFDVYTGKEVRTSRKSVALGLILQDFSRTLVDEDVEELVENILTQLKKQYHAVLREM